MNWHKKWTKIADQSQEVIDFYATRFVEKYGYTIEYVEESPSVPKSIQLMKDISNATSFFPTDANSMFDGVADNMINNNGTEATSGTSTGVVVACVAGSGCGMRARLPRGAACRPQLLGQNDLCQPPCNAAARAWQKAHPYEP